MKTSLLLLVLLVGAVVLAEGKRDEEFKRALKNREVSQHATEVHDGPHPNTAPQPHSRKVGSREDWKGDWKVEERVRRDAEREQNREEEREWKGGQKDEVDSWGHPIIKEREQKGVDAHGHPISQSRRKMDTPKTEWKVADEVDAQGHPIIRERGQKEVDAHGHPISRDGGMEKEGRKEKGDGRKEKGDGRKEKGEGRKWRKHGDDESGERHHGGWHHGKGHWKKFENLTVHFVERSLPVNVYTVLEDKGLQVKAAYGTCGDATVLTKLKLVVEDKTLIISANEKISINGEESDLQDFETLAFENGVITRKHHFLNLKYGVYSIFIKVKTHGDCARVGVRVGVEKTAKVSPGGFIGQRIAVDPAAYTAAEF